MEALLDLHLPKQDQQGAAGTWVCEHVFVYATGFTNGFIVE